MKDMVLLYAGMGVGHLVPMVALAKLFLRHDLSVTILTVEPPATSNSSAALSQLTTANPAISFHILPAIPISVEDSRNPFMRIYDILREGNSNLLDFIVSILKITPVRCIILDMFCTAALEVAEELSIPAYFFFSSAASTLALSLHVPVIDKTLHTSFKDMGRTPINFPGLPPVPANDIPQNLQDRSNYSYKIRIANWPKLIEANGILVNTFEELESKSIKALRAGLSGLNLPPIYCIGPLITQVEDHGRESKHECITWLDSQPKASVVFLCFGSMGAFSSEQIKEIAIGLEKSGQRFLWVVKIQDDQNKLVGSQHETDLYSVLPEGFLDRTEDRGMVVKSWAPQPQVLQHESVGGFVSHCGWNSTLEAVIYGIPMICWPLYAEQRLNKVILVEEFKIATVMDGYDEGFVRAEEVETKVRWLIESKEGKVMKERMVAAKQQAVEALREGRSSSQDLIHFLRDLEQCHQGK